MPESISLTCPCCGYRTISSTYEICDICGWEHDPVQQQNPDMKGANRATLREAQQNFIRSGAAEDRLVGTSLVRAPAASDEKDPNWHSLDDPRTGKVGLGG